MPKRCNVKSLQQEFATAKRFALNHNKHQWSKGMLASFGLGLRKTGLASNLKQNVKTPTGRIQPYLCVRKDKNDTGCFAVGNYFAGQKTWHPLEPRFPTYIPVKKKEQLEAHMKGTNAKVGILAGFTKDEDTMLRFYKLDRQGNINFRYPDLELSFHKELSLTNARKICDLLEIY